MIFSGEWEDDIPTSQREKQEKVRFQTSGSGQIGSDEEGKNRYDGFDSGLRADEIIDLPAGILGISSWPSSKGMLNGSPHHRARLSPLQCENEYVVLALGGNCSPGSSRLYRLGVLQAQKSKESEDERPRLRAS